MHLAHWEAVWCQHSRGDNSQDDTRLYKISSLPVWASSTFLIPTLVWSEWITQFHNVNLPKRTLVCSCRIPSKAKRTRAVYLESRLLMFLALKGSLLALNPSLYIEDFIKTMYSRQHIAYTWHWTSVSIFDRAKMQLQFKLLGHTFWCTFSDWFS